MRRGLALCLVVVELASSDDTQFSTQWTGSDLPEVSDIISRSTEHLQRFSEQAEAVRNRIVFEQNVTKAQLTQQKEAYTSKLQELTDDNRNIADVNMRLYHHIGNLTGYNEEAQRRLRIAETSNGYLVDVLLALEGRLTLAHQFVLDSSKAINDATTSELEAIKQPSGGMNSLQEQLKLARAEMISRKVKLLQPAGAIVSKNGHSRRHTAEEAGAVMSKLSSAPSVVAVHEAAEAAMTASQNFAPVDLVRKLIESIGKLGQVQEAGEEKLKEEFMQLYKDGLRLREELLTKQKELRHVQERQEEAADGLEAALFTMRELHKDLLVRVTTVQAFAAKANEVAALAIQQGSNMTKLKDELPVAEGEQDAPEDDASMPVGELSMPLGNQTMAPGNQTILAGEEANPQRSQAMAPGNQTILAGEEANPQSSEEHQDAMMLNMKLPPASAFPFAEHSPPGLAQPAVDGALYR